jgi:hypothetical protein
MIEIKIQKNALDAKNANVYNLGRKVRSEHRLKLKELSMSAPFISEEEVRTIKRFEEAAVENGIVWISISNRAMAKLRASRSLRLAIF